MVKRLGFGAAQQASTCAAQMFWWEAEKSCLVVHHVPCTLSTPAASAARLAAVCCNHISI